MIKRNCLVHEPGIAIEALASALDPERKPPFKGDILDLLEWATKDVLEMRQQLETERMRLAACGVVALSNTPESAAKARDMLPDYRSASCDDVARAVDREMELRQQLAAALAACKQKDEALEAAHNGLRWWMDAFPLHVTEADNEEMLKLVKALTIQPDDSALKAWLGEPAGEVKKHTGSLKDMAIIVWSGEQPAEGTKLYSPKGLK